MNKNKTNVIWIGKQNWGTTQFDLLELRFSVNLDEMTTLNYSLAFEKAKRLLQSWKWRPLTPIGRIMVIRILFYQNLYICLPQFLPLIINLLKK